MRLHLIILTITALIVICGCDYFFPPFAGEKIAPEEAYAYLKKHSDDQDVVLIDVRTTEEFEKSHITGAINLDFNLTTFPAEIEKLDKSKRYIVYSQNDRNSLMTLELMRENRIEKRHIISGGLSEWLNQGLPLEVK